MSKVNVVFWSQSGNTESMANAVGAGITEAGAEAMWYTSARLQWMS